MTEATTRSTQPTTRSTQPTGVVDPARRWHLEDEREFLVRSLEDARLEHEAGDLADDDFGLLCHRDEQRLAEVEAALADLDATAVAGAGDPPVPSGPGPDEASAEASAEASPATTAARDVGRWWGRRTVRGRRRWLALAGAACVVAAAAVLVVELTSPRLPGQDATGSIDLNTEQQIERWLSQAATLVDQGKPNEALALYGDVLSEDPKDPVALAEWGWLDWQAATTAKQDTVAAEGASAEVEAVKLDGRLFAAQYYLGTILYEEGAAAKAVRHYRLFLADHPTASWLRSAAPTIRAAYGAADLPVPSDVPAAGASGSGSASASSPSSTTSTVPAAG